MTQAEAAVWVALVGAVVTPVVTSVVARRGTKRELEQRVGTPNGHGNVVEMFERLVTGQAGQDNRLAKLERGQLDHEGRIRSIEARHEILDKTRSTDAQGS